MSNTFLKAVYVLKWYEVSNGLRKPNYYSLHASRDIALKFKEDALLVVNNPHYYFDCGALTIEELVSRELFQKVLAQGSVVAELETKFISGSYNV